ncbi:MAG TPA: MBL fold metallo-hydrolase [Clostridiaceae bacterium]|jgi:competence protein ComEC|nr:MBL fold metallo-hydrolase [Clostridiaceae bacterium]
MANKKSQKNTIIGSIITVIILIILTITGNDSQIFKSTTSATNDNVSSEVLDNLENVSIQTGNDCISTIPQDNNLRVYCLDVGQGDSILITNNNKTMLIDASTNEMGSRVVKYLNDLGIKKIDYLVGTHPHEDHIGGLDNVIKNFDIGTIYMPNVVATTKTFEEVIDAISAKKLKVTSPKTGDKFTVGNAECEVMSIRNDKDDYNNCSIVIKMDFNNVSYLFTGDAEESVESSRKWPHIDVLKVGHHGSNTSSSKKFLEQIKPEVALISVGQGNTYGHPTQATLKRLSNIGAKIYRTDENGTILLIEKGE